LTGLRLLDLLRSLFGNRGRRWSRHVFFLDRLQAALTTDLFAISVDVGAIAVVIGELPAIATGSRKSQLLLLLLLLLRLLLLGELIGLQNASRAIARLLRMQPDATALYLHGR